MRGASSAASRAASLAFSFLLASDFPGISAQSPPPDKNSIICIFTVGTKENVIERDGFAQNLVKIGTFVCPTSGSRDSIIEVNSQVTAVAKVVAEVVAEVDLNCKGTGNTNAVGTVRSQAETQAQAVSEAVAGVLDSKIVCPDCTARVESLVNSTQEIIATATLDAVFEIDFSSSPGRDLNVQRRRFKRSVESKTAEALAEVVLDVRASPDPLQGCEGNVVTRAKPDPDNAEAPAAECIINVGASAARIMNDEAIVSLAGEVRASVCEGGGSDSQSFDVTLDAMATAIVDTVAQVDVFCETSGGASSAGCALGEATIEATAKATAQAFAMGLAQAGTCKCEASVTLNERSIEEAFVTASSTAFQMACSTGDNSEFLSDFERTVNQVSVRAVARVILDAVAVIDDDGERCNVTLSEACTETGPCAEDTKVCRGEGISGIIPCCNPGYDCTTQNSAVARCQPRGAKLPSFYEGGVEQPDRPLADCQ